jgi:hypothetical protein
MLAQVVLTPSESKKLIAKAVASLEIVRQAAAGGMVLMHPSSSTYFIVEELTGEKPQTNYWVCGVVTPRGMCVEMAMLTGDYTPRSLKSSPGDFRAWWTVRNNKLVEMQALSGLLKQMTASDVFIKGVNAMDPQGHVGILIGDPLEGGTLGVVFSAWRKMNFNMIFPAGLEKLIPTPIAVAAKEAKQARYDYGMGMPTGLFPCPGGRVISEVDAVGMLSGAAAVPVAAGGLGGAEGAVTLIIKGTVRQVKKAISHVEACKGARLPEVRLSHCADCAVPHCRFPRKNDRR